MGVCVHCCLIILIFITTFVLQYDVVFVPFVVSAVMQSESGC